MVIETLSMYVILIPVDSKILKSEHSDRTWVDEYVRKLLPKLEHIRKLTKFNVDDFKANYKRKYDEKYKTRPTQLKVAIMSTSNRKD